MAYWKMLNITAGFGGIVFFYDRTRPMTREQYRPLLCGRVVALIWRVTCAICQENGIFAAEQGPQTTNAQRALR